MSLILLKQHLMHVKVTSLASLCALFKADAETMRCQLSHFIRKGRLKKCQKTPACGIKCFKCQVVTTETYEWLDTAAIIER